MSKKAPKQPKAFEDYTFSELINLRRQQRQTAIQLEKQFKGFPRNPVLDNTARPNAARGARPNTWWKKHENNTANISRQLCPVS